MCKRKTHNGHGINTERPARNLQWMEIIMCLTFSWKGILSIKVCIITIGTYMQTHAVWVKSTAIVRKFSFNKMCQYCVCTIQNTLFHVENSIVKTAQLVNMPFWSYCVAIYGCIWVHLVWRKYHMIRRVLVYMLSMQLEYHKRQCLPLLVYLRHYLYFCLFISNLTDQLWKGLCLSLV